jgi:Cu(I)/Ag(I) efflux system membrane protein CusA/SilA
MAHPWLSLGSMLALLASTAWPMSRLGSEFMPPLEEGDLLYMPTTDPGISMDKVREVLQQTDALIKQFPESSRRSSACRSSWFCSGAA